MFVCKLLCHKSLNWLTICVYPGYIKEVGYLNFNMYTGIMTDYACFILQDSPELEDCMTPSDVRTTLMENVNK